MALTKLLPLLLGLLGLVNTQNSIKSVPVNFDGTAVSHLLAPDLMRTRLQDIENIKKNISIIIDTLEHMKNFTSKLQGKYISVFCKKFSHSPGSFSK